LVIRIDQLFKKHETGDEQSHGTSNLLVVEIDGTPEAPYINVKNGLVVYELTFEGPSQADITEEFIADEEAGLLSRASSR
jgi:hypothetical protein